MITALYGEKNDRYSYCKQQFIKEWADFWHKQVPQFSIDELIGTVEFYYDVPQLIQCKKQMIQKVKSVYYENKKALIHSYVSTSFYMVFFNEHISFIELQYQKTNQIVKL